MGSFTAGWVTGDVVDAADLNTIAGAFDAFTPTLTNLTLGNGTATGYKKKVGRIVFFWVQITLGSTSSVTGGVRVDLPETANAAGAGGFDVSFFDDSAGAATGYFTGGAIMETTYVALRAIGTAATYGGLTGLSSTIPFTWATSDWIRVAGWYEADA
jgi:hypothetical protein